ncbi:MAG: hypothetical protein R3Y23_02470 [Bacillota bacterium]
MDSQKIKSKAMRWRILKVLSYVLGLPLLVYFVKEAAETYPTGSSDGVTALLGDGQLLVKYIAIALVVVFVIQLILAKLVKSKKTKSVIVAILGFVVAAAPVFYTEVVIQSVFNDYRDAIIEEYDTDIGSYEAAILNYESKGTSAITTLDDFLEYYYINYSGKSFGSNTDGSEVTMVEDGYSIAYYSANGMYSDGYLFGYEQAREIIETYYGTAYAYADMGININDELDAALEDLYATGSAWDLYCRGLSSDYISSADEWELAYGEDGSATGYYLTDERLDEILGVLGTEISENDDLVAILEKLDDSLVSLLGKLDLDLGGLDLSTLNLTELLANPDLCFADIEPFLDAFGFSKTQLFDLLYQYSNYQSPTTYSIYHFIEDEDLQAYAYAKYYGIIHGGKLGSVLVSTFTIDFEDDGSYEFNLTSKVGEISFDATGETAQSWETLQKTFQTIEIAEMWMSDVYPYFVARNYFYVFAGAIAIGIMVSYYSSMKEKELMDKLVAKKGVK